MKNTIFTIFFTLFSFSLWACPGCAGSMENAGYVKVAYILMAFIALTYIPYYFIFKVILKYRNFNMTAVPVDSIASLNEDDK